MELNALRFKSELIFTSFDGLVEDRGSYLVIKTLTNPNFFWGNLLIFDRPPKLGDYQRWIEIFKKEFTDPRIYHVTLAWDSSDGAIGDVSEFLKNGYELEAKGVLAATQVVIPPKFNEKLIVRPLQTESEWNQIINLQINCADDNIPKDEWEKFYTSQSERYKAMTVAGLGNWFGGFIEGQLVCGLGIFHRNGIGRFQIVCTDPNFRRQGLCGTLVYLSAQYAFTQMSINKLIMVADPDYFAIKIYESVGFKKQHIEHGVCWWNRNHKSENN
jgi:RimJ/RimL family protein N-acetyltransferase